jgi:hypothetical protein
MGIPEKEKPGLPPEQRARLAGRSGILIDIFTFLMASLKKYLLLLILPLLAFTAVHKFYISVTQVTYSEKDESLQITSRIFIDDMEKVLAARYGVKPLLATDGELAIADSLVGKYLRSKFVVKVNGTVRPFDFLGKRYDGDILMCYMEVPGVARETLGSVEIQSEVLTDLFEDQKNIVHLTVGDQKRSFVLVRDNNKGMLNL